MSYSRVSGHRDMIFDQIRNAAYERAIEACVGPDSVVLDLGCGLGLHGMMAARAGASRVYLIEPAPVCQLACDIARANGLGDRMVFLPGKAETLELPEKVDVIVSVFTGNLLYSEDLLPVLFDARDRFLARDGLMLPDRGELWAVPIMDERLHQEHVACWSAKPFGLDFQATRRFAANELQWLDAGQERGQRLAAPARLVALDFMQESGADCDCEATLQITQDGFCHGVLTWIRFRLGSVWLSTDPMQTAMHWSNAVLPLDPPLAVQAGEVLHLRLRRPRGGEWSWRLSGPAGSRQHSTFLAQLDNRQWLQSASRGDDVTNPAQP